MRTTQRKGDIATTQAISTFTQMGWDVSVPVTKSARYDLIADSPQGLKRVQVKYSSRAQVDVRNIHSNAQGYVVKKARDNDYDWLYVLWVKEDGSNEEHLMAECFVGRTSVNLTGQSKLTSSTERAWFKELDESGWKVTPLLIQESMTKVFK